MNIDDVIVFFDMDGVLAKYNVDGKWQEKGYFEQLEVEESAVSFLKYLVQKGISVGILSACANTDAKIEKMRWLEKLGLQDVLQIFVPYGSNKSEAVNSLSKAKLLIDDYTKNLNEWDAAGHIPVKFMNGINGTNGTWQKARISCKMSQEEMFESVSSIIKNL